MHRSTSLVTPFSTIPEDSDVVPDLNDSQGSSMYHSSFGSSSSLVDAEMSSSAQTASPSKKRRSIMQKMRDNEESSARWDERRSQGSDRTPTAPLRRSSSDQSCSSEDMTPQFPNTSQSAGICTQSMGHGLRSRKPSHDSPRRRRTRRQCLRDIYASIDQVLGGEDGLSSTTVDPPDRD